jgi:hypothetical protein
VGRVQGLRSGDEKTRNKNESRKKEGQTEDKRRTKGSNKRRKGGTKGQRSTLLGNVVMGISKHGLGVGNDGSKSLVEGVGGVHGVLSNILIYVGVSEGTGGNKGGIREEQGGEQGRNKGGTRRNKGGTMEERGLPLSGSEIRYWHLR